MAIGTTAFRRALTRIEADRDRLKHPLRPMRGPRSDRTASAVTAGLAFLQNLRRGHYKGDQQR